MVTNETFDHGRRLRRPPTAVVVAGGGRRPVHRNPGARRRNSTLAAVRMPVQISLGGFAGAYLAVLLLALVAITYLMQVAKATATSYAIGAARAQQQQLVAEQQQLKYEEARMETPVLVQQRADHMGMVVATHWNYVRVLPLPVNLLKPLY